MDPVPVNLLVQVVEEALDEKLRKAVDAAVVGKQAKAEREAREERGRDCPKI